MRPRILFSASITLAILFLLFCSQSSATRSRLSAMGDLSIVIEDESNMINLWDFGRNPAGFLADDTGSVARSDLLWEPYEGEELTTAPGQFPSLWHAEGDVFRTLVSATFRRNENFAVGVEGKYLFREVNFTSSGGKLEYPEIFLVFSKSLNSLTCVGADIGYVEYTSETRYQESRYDQRAKTKYFQTQLGAARKLSPEITLAALFGYDNIDSEPYSRYSDFHTYWMSVQSVVELKQKLKLGLETVFNLRRQDFRYARPGYENYYFTSLKLRGIYDLTDELQLGLYYFHNEMFAEFFYPFDSFYRPMSSDDFAVAHWGAGCSYEFSDRLSTGIEYHFRDFSQPHPYSPDHAFKHESLNLGVEGELSEALSVRGGYIRTWTDVNPVTGWGDRYKSRENALTLGSGYQPCGLNLILEFSYRYAFRKFEPWYRDYEREVERHGLSFSFKVAL